MKEYHVSYLLDAGANSMVKQHPYQGEEMAGLLHGLTTGANCFRRITSCILAVIVFLGVST